MRSDRTTRARRLASWRDFYETQDRLDANRHPDRFSCRPRDRICRHRGDVEQNASISTGPVNCRPRSVRSWRAHGTGTPGRPTPRRISGPGATGSPVPRCHPDRPQVDGSGLIRQGFEPAPQSTLDALRATSRSVRPQRQEPSRLGAFNKVTTWHRFWGGARIACSPTAHVLHRVSLKPGANRRGSLTAGMPAMG